MQNAEHIFRRPRRREVECLLEVESVWHIMSKVNPVLMLRAQRHQNMYIHVA